MKKTKYRRRRRKRIIRRMIRLCILIILFIFIGKGMGKILSKDAEDEHKDSSREIIEVQSNYIDPEDEVFSNIPSNKTSEILQSMVRQDKRMKTILKNYDEYPEELLEMLSRNIEMLDFVLDYPEKKGNVYANTIGDKEKGSIPLLLQWDQRWGYGNYGESNIGISGCGPTSLSMVITGLTGNKEITPYEVAKFAEENEYYVPGSGTSWSLFTEGSQNFGVQGRELPLSETSIYNALQSGQPIICSMRPGDFTTTGHIIVLTGIKDGKITVNDPNSNERSNKLWDYETLEHQINNLWAFTIL